MLAVRHHDDAGFQSLADPDIHLHLASPGLLSVDPYGDPLGST